MTIFLPSTLFTCCLKPQFPVFNPPPKIVILKFNNEIDSQVYRLCDHGGSRGLKFKEIL